MLINKFINRKSFLLLIFFITIVVIFSIVSFQEKNIILIKNKSDLRSKIFLNEIKPKICFPRTWEINLSKNEIYFFENCELKTIIPIAYQGPEGKWYQTPTGYYWIGTKKEKHISSLFPVYMNYAVQLYEDFFIHEIPYYLNGEMVSSNFSGGCIRLKSDDAKKFFNIVKQGDFVISYKELKDIKLKNYFHQPVNFDEFFIRQRFNNALRVSWQNAFNSGDRKLDYLQHAGIDLAPISGAQDLNVYNIFDGEVVKIVENGKDDHGFGNTVIVRLKNELCELDKALCQKYKNIYVLYGHLENINPVLKEGLFIKRGEIIGKVGATGYGCNYWRIGKDGCDSKNKLDIHLHLEIKTKPVLGSPVPANCLINNNYTPCYGYVPNNPENYGYLNPLIFLSENFN